MKKFVVKTLGCKANSADGQLLEVGLRARGFESTNDLAEAALVIVNSCTVTNEADRQSQKMVRDLHKKYPKAKIIYTGCAAEVNPEQSLKIPGVSAVLGNQNKDRAAQLIDSFFETASDLSLTEPVTLGSVIDYGELKSRHPIDREWPLPNSSFSEIVELGEGSSTFRTRAFIKIQEGCNSFCTYCIIPYGRGPSRSLPIQAVVREIKQLVTHGIQEVILTGINIGDYGIDFSGELQIDALVERILLETGLPRLRISSLDPTEISEKMIQLMEDFPNFCPHFHVSLQHVSTKILKLMKRKYDWADVERTLHRLSQMKRKPFVGMDFITGFPGENEADFNESVAKLKSLFWSRLHVFPYSERKGTPATKLPNAVPLQVRKERARKLQELSLERLIETHRIARAQFEMESLGVLKDVLLESKVKGPDGARTWVSGYAPNYQRVLIQSDQSAVDFRNQIMDVVVSRWVVDRASGEVSWIGERP